jgi:cytochrome c oxidase subunit 4
MAEHLAPHTGEHVPSAPHAGEHAHPGAKEYVMVAVVLAILTVIEVAVYYIEALRPALAPTLLTLGFVKFMLVVLFFMHLKFDNQLFSWLFTGGMVLAIALAIAMLLRPLSGM